MHPFTGLLIRIGLGAIWLSAGATKLAGGGSPSAPADLYLLRLRQGTT